MYLTLCTGAVTQNRSAVMNYVNYDTNVIQKYGTELVGWTFSKFVSPYEIHTIDDVRQLLAALRSGACHWKRLSKLELTRHAKGMEERLAAGETVGKKRKKRADAGVKKGPRKRPLVDSNGMAKTVQLKGKGRAQLPPGRSASVVDSDSDNENDDHTY